MPSNNMKTITLLSDLLDYNPFYMRLTGEGFRMCSIFDIDKVIVNGPATIVLWSDGDKTVVKCAKDEPWDEEKAFALCIAKKALGNKGNYYNKIREMYEKGEYQWKNDK